MPGHDDSEHPTADGAPAAHDDSAQSSADAAVSAGQQDSRRGAENAASASHHDPNLPSSGDFQQRLAASRTEQEAAIERFRAAVAEHQKSLPTLQDNPERLAAQEQSLVEAGKALNASVTNAAGIDGVLKAPEAAGSEHGNLGAIFYPLTLVNALKELKEVITDPMVEQNFAQAFGKLVTLTSVVKEGIEAGEILSAGNVDAASFTHSIAEATGGASKKVVAGIHLHQINFVDAAVFAAAVNSVQQGVSRVAEAHKVMRRSEGERANAAMHTSAVADYTDEIMQANFSEAAYQQIHQTTHGSKSHQEIMASIEIDRGGARERVAEIAPGTGGRDIVSIDVGLVEIALLRGKLAAGDEKERFTLNTMQQIKMQQLLKTVPAAHRFGVYQLLEQQAEVTELFSKCERLRRKDSKAFAAESAKLALATANLIVKTTTCVATFGSATMPIIAASKALSLVTGMITAHDMVSALRDEGYNEKQIQALSNLIEGQKLETADLVELQEMQNASSGFNQLMQRDAISHAAVLSLNGHPKPEPERTLVFRQDARKRLLNVMSTMQEPLDRGMMRASYPKLYQVRAETVEALEQDLQFMNECKLGLEQARANASDRATAAEYAAKIVRVSYLIREKEDSLTSAHAQLSKAKAELKSKLGDPVQFYNRLFDAITARSAFGDLRDPDNPVLMDTEAKRLLVHEVQQMLMQYKTVFGEGTAEFKFLQEVLIERSREMTQRGLTVRPPLSVIEDAVRTLDQCKDYQLIEERMQSPTYGDGMLDTLVATASSLTNWNDVKKELEQLKAQWSQYPRENHTLIEYARKKLTEIEEHIRTRQPCGSVEREKLFRDLRYQARIVSIEHDLTQLKQHLIEAGQSLPTAAQQAEQAERLLALLDTTHQFDVASLTDSQLNVVTLAENFLAKHAPKIQVGHMQHMHVAVAPEYREAYSHVAQKFKGVISDYMLAVVESKETKLSRGKQRAEQNLKYLQGLSRALNIGDGKLYDPEQIKLYRTLEKVLAEHEGEAMEPEAALAEAVQRLMAARAKEFGGIRLFGRSGTSDELVQQFVEKIKETAQENAALRTAEQQLNIQDGGEEAVSVPSNGRPATPSPGRSRF